MASNNSVLSRELSAEERQWVRSLAEHPGWLLVAQALAELHQQAYRSVLVEEDPHMLFSYRSEMGAYEKALGLSTESGQLLRRREFPSGGR